MHPDELRFITYLSPGIPLAFFEAVVEYLRTELGLRASLVAERRISGPEKGVRDPFSKGEADVGFMCSPPYLWLREAKPPPVELLGAAPVFRDGRNGGKPVYFCDVVVRRDSPIQSFSGLWGCSWAYNDSCSFSGYFSLLNKLAEVGEDEGFFSNMLDSGTHLKSMEMVASGEADASAIDSNVLAMRLRSAPELRERLRVIETWGPFPIQPIVVRSGLSRALKEALRRSLLAMDATERIPDGFGLRCFAPVTDRDYSAERLMPEIGGACRAFSHNLPWGATGRLAAEQPSPEAFLP